MSTETLPFHLPEIGEEEIASVVETLRSGWLTTGAKVQKFEQNFAGYLGCSHAVAVNSGTAALHVALEAIGIKPGDEVILPTLTFTATAEVVLYLHGKPVLVDCNPATLNIDIADIERKISPRTRAIIPVHFAGQPCEMQPILDIAQRYGLKVVEDAAHALPAKYHGQKIGTLGDITCFSLYVTKTITTGEGGVATTRNPEWAERMRMMSLHGISKDAWNRYSSEGSWYYEVVSPGYKYNLTGIAAAIGIEQLNKCDRLHERRRAIAGAYDGLAGLPEIELPVCAADLEHAWHLYVVQLKPEKLTIDRNQFIELLKKRPFISFHYICIDTIARPSAIRPEISQMRRPHLTGSFHCQSFPACVSRMYNG